MYITMVAFYYLLAVLTFNQALIAEATGHGTILLPADYADFRSGAVCRDCWEWRLGNTSVGNMLRDGALQKNWALTGVNWALTGVGDLQTLFLWQHSSL